MPESGRVIAGSARGTRLEAARDGTRPLSDRVKQALFATLESERALDDGFLDLFAGTGAAGIEALSRGADRATMVERSSRAAALIETNLRRAKVSHGRVVHDDVLRFLAGGRPREDAPYAACLADPPYDEPLLKPALELLADRSTGWLADKALVVAKHFWRDAPGNSIGSLTLARQRRFGETMLSFYRPATEESA